MPSLENILSRIVPSGLNKLARKDVVPQSTPIIAARLGLVMRCGQSQRDDY